MDGKEKRGRKRFEGGELKREGNVKRRTGTE